MKQAIWLVSVLALAFSGAACGDSSDNGGDAGSGGSSATGGTGGSSATGGTSGDACAAICSSVCIDDVATFTDDEFADCQEGCGQVFTGCESETLGLLDCLEGVDCDEDAAASQCTGEALDFTECFSGFAF